jgi:small subunit ribosomal protein S20
MKRERQNEKRRTRNRGVKAALRTEVKKVRSNPNAETLKATTSCINRTASKGVIPRRRASRMISKLTRMVSAQQ